MDDGVPPAFLAWVAGDPRRGAAAGARVAGRERSPRFAVTGAGWRCSPFAEIAIPFPLIAAGEQHVASSLAAIIIATAPLFVALLALRFDASERVTGRRLVGLLIGLGGVAALVGIDVAGSGDELLGAMAILVAAFCYAVGPMVLKRHLAKLDQRASMGASLALAALFLAPAVAVDPPTAPISGEAIAALVVLGMLCTAAAFVLYGMLIAEVGAGRALVVTYINPVIAVGLGVAILGERPGAGAIAGLLLILAGSWLSTDGRLPPSPTAIVTEAQGAPPPARGGRPGLTRRIMSP